MIPIPIYIIHYPPLIKRKLYLKQVIKKPIWLTDYQKENLTEDDINTHYKKDSNLWNEKVKGLYEKEPPYYEMPKGMISCSIAHIKALEKISKLDSPGIILEDDAILIKSSLEESIQKVIDSPPPNWDIIFLGGAFNHEVLSKTIARINNEYVLKDHPASNTVCAYMVNPEAAKKIIDVIIPFTLPIDFELNYWMKELKMNVYHVQPYFIREGTSAGFYETSQNTENRQ